MNATGAPDGPRRIVILDGGSFVLPYDLQRVRALAAAGHQVAFYGSQTRYNADCLAAMRTLAGVDVVTRRISGSVASRWRGVIAYAALLAGIARRRSEYDVVELQFSILWPVELPLLWWLRNRLVFAVHNAVPHGHAKRRHSPTRWIADIARRLVFVSTATRDDFLARYGERFARKCTVLQHGPLPVDPLGAPVPYDRPAARLPPQALVFWGNVQPYKGVDLFAALADDPAWRAGGLGLEVHGVWARRLLPLRDALRSLGVQVDDSFLDTPRLLALLARPVVFVLPYEAASQSGVLYALLAQGCVFMCADVGDLGDFMRRHGLSRLLLRNRSATAVLDCLRYLQIERDAILRAFQQAQDACRWSGVAVL